MGQVNVNTPNGGTPGEPAGSSSAGFILGIVVAIVVIVALVYFLVLNPGNDNGTDGTDGTDTENGATESQAEGDDGGSEAPAPSGWRLVDLA